MVSLSVPATPALRSFSFFRAVPDVEEIAYISWNTIFSRDVRGSIVRIYIFAFGEYIAKSSGIQGAKGTKEIEVRGRTLFFHVVTSFPFETGLAVLLSFFSVVRSNK